MKKILSIMMAAVLAVLLTGCNKYDDTELRERIGKLETSMNQLLGYQSLLQKLSEGKTVTGINQSGNEITLTFSDNSRVSFNQQGEAGKSLTWDDLTDEQKAALQGNPGADGRTPVFKIENETWQVSYDDGGTWTEVGSAIDRSLIKCIAMSEDGNTLLITLADGTVVPVAIGKKEAYSLTIANNYYSIFENKGWFGNQRLEIPYTLTGESSYVPMVVIPRTDGGVMSTYASVRTSPGKLIIHMLPINSDVGFAASNYGYYGWNYSKRGGEVRWPTVEFLVTAYFPDGTSAFRSFTIVGHSLYATEQNFGMTWYKDEEKDYYMPRVDIPATAGQMHFKFGLYSRTAGWAEGTLISEAEYDEFFRALDSDPMFDNITTEQTGYLSVDEKGQFDCYFNVTVDFNANTTGAERQTVINLYYCQSANVFTFAMPIKIVQSK